jgi:hypothetical protein
MIQMYRALTKRLLLWIVHETKWPIIWFKNCSFSIFHFPHLIFVKSDLTHTTKGVRFTDLYMTNEMCRWAPIGWKSHEDNKQL